MPSSWKCPYSARERKGKLRIVPFTHGIRLVNVMWKRGITVMLAISGCFRTSYRTGIRLLSPLRMPIMTVSNLT